MSPFVARWLVKSRWLLLLIAVLAAAAAVRPAGQVRFDRSIENMFAPHDPLLVPYRRMKRVFGGNEVVLAVFRDDHLLDANGQGLRRLRQVSDRLRAVPGVRDVLSLAEVDQALTAVQRLGSFGGLFGTSRPADSPAILDAENPLAVSFLNIFQGYTHDRTGTVAAVACMLVPEAETETPRSETIARLRAEMQNPPGSLPPGMLAGEPVMVVDGFAYLEQDGRRLGWASTILLSLTIVACFRSLRWVLIPVAVVQLSLLLTRACLVWSGLRLSMVSSMLTALVTVVGVATVVHVIVRFRQARAHGQSPREALIAAGSLLLLPITLACLTDAVGFGSLLVAQVGPVRDFGLMMAIGSLVVLLSVALLVPGLTLLGGLDTDPHRAWGERRLGITLDRIVRWVDRRPRTTAAAVLVLLALAVSGVFRLRVETDFTKNFRPASPIVRSYDFVEEHLGGAGVWDVLVPAPARLDQEFLERVLELEDQLRSIPAGDAAQGTQRSALTKVISLADAMQATQQDAVLRRLPLSLRVDGMAAAMPTFIRALYSRDPEQPERRLLRIMLRAPERQSAAAKERLIAEVTRLARAAFPEQPADPKGEAAGAAEPAAEQPLSSQQPDAATRAEGGAQVTGFFVLLTNLIKSVIADQWLCFAVASAGIGLMMWLAFRSPLLAGVALVPNALPVLVVLGGMGWLGLRINMGAAMIAAVSMGLSVDSSIHYITAFRRARAEGKSVYVALADVQQMVGRAAVFSTVALIVGFAVLCSSRFVPTIYFGGLACLSMLGGLLGNLVVLPLLLKLVTRDDGDERRAA